MEALIVTIHQPEHLPWCGFLHKASLSDILVLLDNVQYRKNYFQNRNMILGANGPQWVTIPVSMKGHTEKTIADMEIVPGPWAEKWWKSLLFSYRRSPHFSQHAPFFEALAQKPWTRLAPLNEEIIRYLLNAFGISCKILRASELPVAGVRSQLLRGICAHLGAKSYLAGRHGKDYLDESLFRSSGIAVSYHEFSHPIYAQRGGEPFVPNLSAIDLLFRHGPESAAILRSGTVAASI